MLSTIIISFCIFSVTHTTYPPSGTGRESLLEALFAEMPPQESRLRDNRERRVSGCYTRLKTLRASQITSDADRIRARAVLTCRWSADSLFVTVRA